jgi:hypothetical protein
MRVALHISCSCEGFSAVMTRILMEALCPIPYYNGRRSARGERFVVVHELHAKFFELSGFARRVPPSPDPPTPLALRKGAGGRKPKAIDRAGSVPVRR